ncbi:unnamed protein product [Didymodactylos carnosus]|uniref:Uncharacterized protein n=1 Tax=Didymodactylos carnosus TaxID=1234261 RepID=A0A814FIU5_9BILA|nr:unnamed protein product [Didymodactylos carnosus]CAF0981933.1 unnamed protein product [Didymodactylos carnosus]CAF3501937.1 unnamed protein product [Didymodactylos carnosus]CAF3754439.1 unnamed protein product [Didymodactylos carnosus]
MKIHSVSLKVLILPNQLLNIVNDNYSLFKNVRAHFNIVVMGRSYAKTGEVYYIRRLESKLGVFILQLLEALSPHISFRIKQSGLAECVEYLIQSFYDCVAPLVTASCQTKISEQNHVYLPICQQPKDLSISSIKLYT